jgi:hypothetical protein
LATPATLPNSSVTDEPIATAAVANIVLVDMTPPVSLVVVLLVDVAAAVRAVPTAGSSSARYRPREVPRERRPRERQRW